MSGRAGPSGRNRYAGVGVSVGRTGVAVGAGPSASLRTGVTVGVSVQVGVAVNVGVAVEVAVAVGDGVAVGVPVEVAVSVGVNAAVGVPVGTTASETTGWGTDVPGPQAPIPTTLRMMTIPITNPRFFLMPLSQPFYNQESHIT